MEKQDVESKEKIPGSKKKIFLVVLVIIIAFAGFRVYSSRSVESETEEKSAVNVQVVTAARADIMVETPLSGKIEPKDQVSVHALLQAEVTGVFVEVGDYVAKGATLFTLDAAQISGSYDQAAASLNIANESLASAKTNFDRMSLLYKEGAVSQQQYEQAQTQYNTALQQVSQSQSMLSTAGDALKNATATAPISGYVTEVNVIQGGYPSQAAPAVSIANTNDLEINTTVSEYLIGKVTPGQKVSVVVKSLSDTAYTGTITSIAPAPSAGTLTYPITVKIDENQQGIVAGMFAEIQVVSDKRENVISVPSESVLIKSGVTQVVVLDKENIPSFLPVETGLDNGTLVEIISGLTEGQTVVSVGQNYVAEGEAVKIQTDSSDSDQSKTK